MSANPVSPPQIHGPGDCLKGSSMRGEEGDTPLERMVGQLEVCALVLFRWYYRPFGHADSSNRPSVRRSHDLLKKRGAGHSLPGWGRPPSPGTPCNPPLAKGDERREWRRILLCSIRPTTSTGMTGESAETGLCRGFGVSPSSFSSTPKNGGSKGVEKRERRVCRKEVRSRT